MVASSCAFHSRTTLRSHSLANTGAVSVPAIASNASESLDMMNILGEVFEARGRLRAHRGSRRGCGRGSDRGIFLRESPSVRAPEVWLPCIRHAGGLQILRVGFLWHPNQLRALPSERTRSRYCDALHRMTASGRPWSPPGRTRELQP